jgi:hypothetical protein
MTNKDKTKVYIDGKEKLVYPEEKKDLVARGKATDKPKKSSETKSESKQAK